jgi:uncharacterized protein YodC (DUF2158 family)
MTEFKKGDNVKLKSGGPKMTIKELMSSETCHCQWFAGQKLQEGYFDPESLVLVEAEENEE